MPRIRSIKPEFWTSAQVLECSTNARLLFVGLWCFCDDAGRHPLSAKQIKAEVFPADPFTESDILGMLQELSRNGLILIYSIESKEFLQVTGWKHQRIDKPQPAKYPGPFSDHSTNDPGALPPDRIGEDRKGKDKKGKDKISPPDGGDAAKVVGKKYVYENGKIRIDQKTMDRWRLAFPEINVLAELESMSGWDEAQGKNWYHAVAGLLAKRNRAALDRKAAIKVGVEAGVARGPGKGEFRV